MKGQRRTGLWRVARTLAVAALLSLQPLMPTVEASHPAVPPADGFAPGLVLVKFKPLVPNFMADASLSVQGFRTLTTIYGSDVRKIAVAPGDEILSIAGLQSNPLVEYAEPDYTLEPLWIPNDTYYGPNQWNFRKIDLERAWDITRGSPTIRVAVVDTGLNMGNPDRPVNIASPWNECSGGPAIYDFNNHGTHVSGIIAANSNNGAGVAGVAPGISLMPITVECDGIIAVSSAAAAARYAADNGARVINVSLGITQASQTWRDAIDYATGKGTLVVAAAGNGYQSGNQPVYPAAYPGVLAVGASTCEDERASYSQAQPYVAVVAPGGDASAFTDLDSSHWIMSTFGASYGSMAGTSQASPHVAGLAGLIWSVNPELTSAQVTGIITSTAVDLGPPGLDSQYGWGRIDAFAALVKAQTTAPLPSPTTTPTTVPPPTSTPTAVPVPSPTPLPTPTPIISNVPYRIHIPLLVKNGPGL